MLVGATQRHRIAELTTPLGPDKLLLNSFTANEALSQLFEIRIEAESADHNIEFNPAIGTNCRIRLRTQGDKTRYFSGVLVEAAWTGTRQERSLYELVLRPWLWLLTQGSDNRIFQKMTVLEIIQKVFTDLGFTDFEVKCKESYPKIDYCVQYRESHFAFVSRLMERHGIYYFFTHTDTKHVMVLADGKGGHAPVADLPQCRFVATGEKLRVAEETISTWHASRVFRTGRVTVNAFDFDKPSASLIHDQSQPGGYQHGSQEIYEFTDKYKQPQVSDLGQKFAKALLQSRQAQDKRRKAEGDAASLFAGGLVTITGRLPDGEKGEYLVISASHAFVGEAFSSGYGDGDENSYRGVYELQPSDRPFRAPVMTPRPHMSGPQTATVVGPAGEEIHTDKHGRIKVQFHWDRQGKRDEQSSRWVRVAQMHSGKNWGSLFLPRIGMEVVVDFIEGDPDRPLVVGTVYNGTNAVPYSQPANKTQSGIKTRSSKGGGEGDYNEFLFEDKKGSEFVRLHAEKDLQVTIEDKETRTLKGKNKKDVGETTRQTVIEKGDDVADVMTGDQKVHVGNDYSLRVDQKVLIKAETSITIECGQSTIEIFPTAIEIKTPSLSIKTQNTLIDAKAMLEQVSAMIKLN